MSRWTHPICDIDWVKQQGNRVPHRLTPAELEICSFCGKPTSSGIYVRRDPDLVPFPPKED